MAQSHRIIGGVTTDLGDGTFDRQEWCSCGAVMFGNAHTELAAIGDCEEAYDEHLRVCKAHGDQDFGLSLYKPVVIEIPMEV